VTSFESNLPCHLKLKTGMACLFHKKVLVVKMFCEDELLYGERNISAILKYSPFFHKNEKQNICKAQEFR